MTNKKLQTCQACDIDVCTLAAVRPDLLSLSHPQIEGCSGCAVAFVARKHMTFVAQCAFCEEGRITKHQFNGDPCCEDCLGA